MRKHLQYIFLALATVVLAVSCVKELEFEQPMGEGDALTLVPRVRSFANQYVTKATPYDGDKGEKNITRLAVFVFNSKGDLIHWYEDTSGSDAVTLNKSMLNSPAQSSMLDNATVVLIANVNLDDVKKGTVSIKDNSDLTLDDLENYAINTSGTVFTEADLKAEDFSGLPMIGGIKVDLTHAAGSQDVEVGMKILYAKIKFNLSVAAGTENQGSGMKFDLTGYSVHNTSTATTLAIPANMGEKPVDFLGNEKADAVQATVDVATASNEYQTNAKDVENPASTSTSTDGIEFTFYIPESRYNHNLEIGDLQTVYPTDWCTNEPSQDVKNYQTGQKLNKVKYFYDDLTQQFKPKIAEKTGSTKAPQPGAGLATYVLLKGSYTDYKGDIWDLKYKVYLGKDNDQNFHVDRNSIYTNNITIKGIRNNDSYGTDQVWVDHRVTVENASGAADCVTITRETLIDSHIEVRPLRVKWGNDRYAGARVYLPTNADGTTPVNWIGIERFTGNNNQEGAVYCYQNGKSIGKRKYFTTGLISELQSKSGELGVQTDNGKKFIYLLDGECAWIYFDENPTTSERTADIKLAFYSAGGEVQAEEIYQIRQRGLQSIGGYTVESYEEYLHSYDSADKYNLSTNPADYTQRGLSWGLDDKTISKDIIVSATSLDGIQNYIDQRYDYFHKSDVPPTETYYTYKLVDGSWTNASFGTGLIFTDRASIKEGITIKDMGTVPENAYQYCLSKNKFNEDADGNHTLDIHWYLPDVYELKAVLTASQNNTSDTDFGSDVYYWSSQPSFGGISLNIPIINREVSIKSETVTNARAVSVNDTKDINRSVQNRIRCFYSAAGIKTDMTDRTPDGIGGNYSFYMKAYKDNTKSSEAYFSFLMPELQRNTNTTTDAYDYNDNSFPYPTFNNPGSYFGYFDNVVDAGGTSVKGFGNNPLDQKYWSPHEDDASYYYALKDFPGLTAYELEELEQWWQGQGAFRPTATKKSDIQIVTTSDKLQLTRNLPGANLNSLDHLNGGDMIKISFSNGNNAGNTPHYVYSENDGTTIVTTTRYWNVPTYASDTYTPKAASNTETFTGTATSTVNGIRSQYTEAQTKARENADADALAAAKKAAEDKYPNRTYTYGEPTYSRSQTYKSNKVLGVEFSRNYTCTTTCTIEITCTATASPVTYYQNASNGGWDAGTPTTQELNGIETDQLVMFCGNSLTISVADAYKNTHEITKVKVYFSGNNLVATPGTGDKVFTRFVDSTISLPKEKTISKGGSTETLQLIGMDYNDDETSGTGTHQWSGDGRTSITLALADYFVNNNILSNSYTYKYATAAQNLTESIIIDRIEVKCTPISTE